MFIYRGVLTGFWRKKDAKISMKKTSMSELNEKKSPNL